MMGIGKLSSLLAIWMTLVFIQGNCSMKKENILC